MANSIGQAKGGFRVGPGFTLRQGKLQQGGGIGVNPIARFGPGNPASGNLQRLAKARVGGVPVQRGPRLTIGQQRSPNPGGPMQRVGGQFPGPGRIGRRLPAGGRANYPRPGQRAGGNGISIKVAKGSGWF